MPKRGKSFLVTTEKHELVIVRRSREPADRGFCEACADDVEMLDFNDGIVSSGLTGRELVRQIESGSVHPIETADGRFGVCGRSLQMEKDDARDDRE